MRDDQMVVWLSTANLDVVADERQSRRPLVAIYRARIGIRQRDLLVR